MIDNDERLFGENDFKQGGRVQKNSISSQSLIDEIDFWLESISFNGFYNEINKRVIGQENLNLILANVYNYLFNVANNLPINHNTILAAPSGSGKTETYRALKTYFKEYIPSLPVYIQDMSRITATGYKGMEPSDLLVPFFNLHLSDAVGIVFLDEFDKKLIPSFNGMGQDTNREAQSCLLTLVEGSLVQSRNGECVDTSKIMFVGLGSFDECRETKKNKPNEMGFESTLNDDFQLFEPITKKDMISAGGIYELIGRFPIIINYHELNKDGIISIINKTTEGISENFNCTIKISDQMMQELLEEANGNFGCRMIDSIIRQNVLNEYTKALITPNPDKKLVIKLNSKEKTSHSWRNLSKNELKDKALLEAFNNATNMPTFVY